MSNELLITFCACFIAALFVGFVFAMMLLSDRVFHPETDGIFKPKGNYNTGYPTIPREDVTPPPKPKP